jgi:hypothetical protein
MENESLKKEVERLREAMKSTESIILENQYLCNEVARLRTALVAVLANNQGMALALERDLASESEYSRT